MDESWKVGGRGAERQNLMPQNVSFEIDLFSLIIGTASLIKTTIETPQKVSCMANPRMKAKNPISRASTPSSWGRLLAIARS